MMHTLSVKDLMSQPVVTVYPTTTIAEAYDLMDRYHIRHLPVVETSSEGDELVGILTHRDLSMKALFVTERHPYSESQELLRQKLVAECMTTQPESVEADTALSEAAEEMLANKFGCLPVVEGSHLVGILTEADFMHFIVNKLAEGENLASIHS